MTSEVVPLRMSPAEAGKIGAVPEPGPASLAPAAAALSPAERRDRSRRRRVLGILAVLAVGLTAAFLLVGIQGSWQFALELRVWRLAALVVVGVAVGVSTVLFQTVTTNRILTPSIMGFDSLFVLVQTLAVAGLGASSLVALDGRIRFGVETLLLLGFGVALSSLLGRSSDSRDVYVLVLIGIVLGTLFSSTTLMVSRLIDPNEYLTLQDLLFASFGTVDRELLPLTAVVVLAGTLWAARLGSRLDVVALGRPTAVALGVDHRRMVVSSLVVVSLLVATSTALVGPLTFLGLLAANLARQALGTHLHRWTLPGACLVAVVALVGGQLVLEHLLGWTTALSVVINVVGGAYFIALLLRESRL